MTSRHHHSGRPVIDTHGHMLVPEASGLAEGHPRESADAAAERASFTAASVAANQSQLKRVWPQLTSARRRLADLDAMGVDIQLVGPMPMHRYWAEPALAERLTTVINNAVAAHCADGAGRLYGLGTLPLQHPAIAVRELERAVTELGLKGVSVSTSVDGRELADKAFDPVWEAAAGLGAVVFIHPWGCSLGARLAANFLGNTFGQPAETALALSHLIFGGTLDRHPGLKLLAAHGGGFLPTYIGRSDHAWANRPDARGCAQTPSSYLRRIWYDALVYTPRALRHLIDAAGADKVVLGTDYPFDMGVTDPVERVRAAGLPAAGIAAVLSGNAAALFTLTEGDGR
ncbi:amidohydrolase family protein [Trebonia sp.]|uniref:amidohydrolase family protein n=1 Tax=Trebonia sp. TaxID=2767075 RepID=UPI002613CBC6|nr:amidohydrolase family protein [Trebonia sp.]